MRQVGDQLIPVGITSGRVVALPPGSEGSSADEGSGRRRRRDRNNDLTQFLGSMGMAGQDLEEVRHLLFSHNAALNSVAF